MIFLVSVLSIIGSFLYFVAFKKSNYQSDALLLGFIVCIVFLVFGFSILQLREKIKEQKAEIEELKKAKGMIPDDKNYKDKKDE